jgi:hypothetical protein
MTGEEMPGAFGGFDPADYEDEARERWSGTEAYRQSVEKTASYTKADWEAVRAESDEINRGFFELMKAATPPADPATAAMVDRHRDHITRWFYECTPEIHAGLGHMYTTDSRFTENIDRAGDELAEYISAAIAARYAEGT